MPKTLGGMPSDPLLRPGRAALRLLGMTNPTSKEAALEQIAQDGRDTHAANHAALEVVAATHGPAMASLLACTIEADKFMMFIGPTVVQHFGSGSQGHAAIEGLTAALFGSMQAGFRLAGLPDAEVESLLATFQECAERQRWSINKARGTAPATS